MALALMIVSAALLAGVGLVLNFAPVEVARSLGLSDAAAAAVVLQVLAGALLGLGFMNWMLRRSVHGIFGRPLGVANLLCFFVAALSLIRAAHAGIAPSLTWTSGALTALLSLGFTWLVFFRDRVAASTDAS